MAVLPIYEGDIIAMELEREQRDLMLQRREELLTALCVTQAQLKEYDDTEHKCRAVRVPDAHGCCNGGGPERADAEGGNNEARADRPQ